MQYQTPFVQIEFSPLRQIRHKARALPVPATRDELVGALYCRHWGSGEGSICEGGFVIGRIIRGSIWQPEGKATYFGLFSCRNWGRVGKKGGTNTSECEAYRLEDTFLSLSDWCPMSRCSMFHLMT